MDDANLEEDDDPVAQVRRARMERGERFGFDLKRLGEDTLRSQNARDWPIVDFSRPSEKKPDGQ